MVLYSAKKVYSLALVNVRSSNVINKMGTNLSFWMLEEIPDTLYIPSTTPSFSMNSAQLFTTCGTARDSKKVPIQHFNEHCACSCSCFSMPRQLVCNLYYLFSPKLSTKILVLDASRKELHEGKYSGKCIKKAPSCPELCRCSPRSQPNTLSLRIPRCRSF